MDYRELKELVRIRYELRDLAGQRDQGRAASLLDRMFTLAARDPAESAAVQTEMLRWKFVFGLET
jgi:hypothetical protein